MKRFYITLSICLFIFFLIPKVNTTYDGFMFLAMMVATCVGEMIIPLVVWYALYFIAMKIESFKSDPLLAMKVLVLVALFSATTSIGLIFPEYSALFDG